MANTPQAKKRIRRNQRRTEINRTRVSRIRTFVKQVEAAIEAGGSSLRDYARPSGELGYFSKQWRGYGREGEACHCGSPIRRRSDSGRSTFFCPRCQRA